MPEEGQLYEPRTYRRRNIKGCLRQCMMGTSLEDVKSFLFWKAVFAEFIGTFILVLLGIGSTIQGWEKSPQDVVQISLSFGICVATSVWIIGHISGGHINPAVTFAFFITRKISFIKTLIFIIIQSLGAIAAAGLLKALTPEVQRKSLGCTTLSPGVTTGMGFGIEFFLTLVLVLTVFASCDSHRKDLGGSFPLTIGLSVTVGHLWAAQVTGSSMNPARSLGPAVVMEIWKDHWVYWIGPMAGGAIAGLLYEYILAKNASLLKARDCLMTSDFDEEKYTPRPIKIKLLEDLAPAKDPDGVDGDPL